jgi:hypothetical protein
VSLGGAVGSSAKKRKPIAPEISTAFRSRRYESRRKPKSPIAQTAITGQWPQM